MAHYLDTPRHFNRELSPAEFASVQYFRPPAWRNERARLLIGRKAARLRGVPEDPVVMAAYRFLKYESQLKKRDLNRQDLVRKLASRFPILACVYEYVSEPKGSIPKAALEASILAGMSDADIGKRLGRPENVIRAYRELFYDITDRLDSIDYIAGFVLAPVFQAGLETLNVELMAKYFGYFGGPAVLQQMFYGMERNTTLASDGEVLGYLESAIHRTVKQQTATMAVVMTPGRFDIRTLFEGYAAIAKIEQDAQRSSQEQNWIAQLVACLRGMNPIPRSLNDRRKFADDVHKPSEPLPMELRRDEKYRLVTGEVTKAEMSEALAAFTRPAPAGPQNATESDK